MNQLGIHLNCKGDYLLALQKEIKDKIKLQSIDLESKKVLSNVDKDRLLNKHMHEIKNSEFIFLSKI